MQCERGREYKRAVLDRLPDVVEKPIPPLSLSPFFFFWMCVGTIYNIKHAKVSEERFVWSGQNVTFRCRASWTKSTLVRRNLGLTKEIASADGHSITLTNVTEKHSGMYQLCEGAGKSTDAYKWSDCCHLTVLSKC